MLTRMRTAFKFCLPTAAKAVPAGTDWIHDIKYDGCRLRVERQGKTVRLFTRNGRDWKDRFPWIVQAALKNREQHFVVDGEAVGRTACSSRRSKPVRSARTCSAQPAAWAWRAWCRSDAIVAMAPVATCIGASNSVGGSVLRPPTAIAHIATKPSTHSGSQHLRWMRRTRAAPTATVCRGVGGDVDNRSNRDPVSHLTPQKRKRNPSPFGTLRLTIADAGRKRCRR